MSSATMHALGTVAIAIGTLAAQQEAKQLEAAMSGGETSVVIARAQMADRDAFSLPASNLSLTRRGDFFAGNSFFQNAWVTAPASVKARDGLGPLFNTMSCQSCHIKDGRGRPPRPGEDMISMLVRISVPGPDTDEARRMRITGGVVPEPIYGDQIQNHAIAGHKAEVQVELEWTKVAGRFADGTPYELRRPTVHLQEAAYGPIADDVQTSPRVAPALIGMGLLDTVPVETLAELADPDDANGDGISGRFNMVWHATQNRTVPGRFGWKCEQPDIRQQSAGAFNGDIGITSSIFPNDSLTAAQRAHIEAPDGGKPEVSDEILDLVVFYCKTLAVPARRSHDDPVVLEGERLFREANCHACHTETLTTGDDPAFPELSGQTIHAYTDLLLHDMGEGLADGRPVYEATGSEWRTPPLWGIGLVYLVNRHTNFLHDGRARSIEEAILWHGGEAEASKQAYAGYSRQQRRSLLAFLKSL